MADNENITGNVSRPELLRRVLDAQRRTIRTATPGVIQSYRRTGDQKNTADVELPVRPEGEAQTVLSHVPVLILGGGDGYLIFPYEAGDPGVVNFCDTEIGTWRTSGDVGAPADDGRLNSAGPVLIPGLRPVGDALDAPAGATVLAGSDVRLGDGAATKAAIHEDLLSDLNSLCNSLSTWVTQVNAAGPFAETANLLIQIATIVAGVAGGSYESPSVKVED